MTAQRIHATELVYAKRKGYYNRHGGKSVKETPTICSCWMCGNPRKWFKQPTIQERRMFQEIPA